MIDMLSARELLKLANGEEEEEVGMDVPLPAGAREKVMALFRENPSPPDEEMHELAEELGVHPARLEGLVYKMFGEKLKTGQKHENVPVTNFDPKQIRAGMSVEKEHTDDPAKAQEIAKDHLSEFPDYYTRLLEMEGKADDEKKKLEEKAKEAFYRGFQEELQKIGKQSWKDWAQVNLNPFAQGGRAKPSASRTFGGGANQQLLAQYMK
jgi:hypothetical protein